LYYKQIQFSQNLQVLQKNLFLQKKEKFKPRQNYVLDS